MAIEEANLGEITLRYSSAIFLRSLLRSTFAKFMFVVVPLDIIYRESRIKYDFATQM